jgi:acyl carrier protein
MEQIRTALKNVFPELKDEQLTDGLKLCDIPGWDSMNVINLQLELETLCKVDLSSENIPGEMTVSQLEEKVRLLSGK